MDKKKLMFVILVFIVIIVLFLVIKLSTVLFLIIKLSGGKYSTDKKIKKEFYDNYDTISYITEALEEETSYSIIKIQGVDYIYDDGNFGTWFVCDDEIGTERTEKIQDVELVEALNKIFKERKYEVVRKNDKTILFQLWATLDVGKGVVYVSGGEEPSIEFLTKYEKLDKENWFYYESDFNKWKLKNE